MATVLKPNQIKTIINSVYNQMTSTATGAIDARDMIDLGSVDSQDLRDQFTQKLLVEIAKVYYNETGKQGYDNPWVVDSIEYGGIIECIKAKAPDAIDNQGRKDLANGDTLGTYTIALPTVENKIFSKESTWSLPITISGARMKEAFKDETSLSGFVAYLMTVFEDGVVNHRNEMAQENRNFFIAQKINSAGANNVVNVIEMYCKEYNKPAGTYKWSTVYNDKDFLLYVTTLIDYYVMELKELNNYYATGSIPYCVPEDRLVCELNNEYVRRLNVAMSDVRQPQYLKLPNYNVVSRWQCGRNRSEDMLRINQTVGSYAINHRVLGIVADKSCCMIANKSDRTVSKYFEFEDVTHIERQFVDMCCNNLSQKAIVFSIEDYTVPTPTTSGNPTD